MKLLEKNNNSTNKLSNSLASSIHSNDCSSNSNEIADALHRTKIVFREKGDYEKS